MTELTEASIDKARELMRAEQERNPILDTADAYRAALARLVIQAGRDYSELHDYATRADDEFRKHARAYRAALASLLQEQANGLSVPQVIPAGDHWRALRG